jgi:hypothetical protein
VERHAHGACRSSGALYRREWAFSASVCRAATIGEVNTHGLPGPVVAARAPIARRGKIVDVRRMGRLLLVTMVSGGAAYLALGRLLRPSYSCWGATDEEVRRTLPGDELVPAPRAQSTWAVTIEAPPERVWPWLVQMGQDRAGFYTYEWFENGLLRLNIHNADRTVPEWQNITVGDRMWFYPETYPIKPRSGPRIVAIEPNRVLLLCHQVTDDATTCPGTWQFVLEAGGENATRLMLRARSGPSPTTWFDILAEPAYFLMTRGMMLGIKRRAETSSAN